MLLFTRESLHQSLSDLGARQFGNIFEELKLAHQEPERFYHTDKHVSECLKLLQEFQHLAIRPHELAVAIWFHDAIYNPRRNDNEERSAAWADEYLSNAGGEPECVERVEEMILATKHHRGDQDDIRLMLDIDLGILGTSSGVFDQYDTAIRQEYSWISDSDYRKGRARVLGSFLERETIYGTKPFRERFESQARENLARKINELSS